MRGARYVIFFALLGAVVAFWTYSEYPERMTWPWVLLSGPCVFIRDTQSLFYMGDPWTSIRWAMPFLLLFAGAVVVALDKRLPTTIRVVVAAGAFCVWIPASMFWVSLMMA